MAFGKHISIIFWSSLLLPHHYLPYHNPHSSFVYLFYSALLDFSLLKSGKKENTVKITCATGYNYIWKILLLITQTQNWAFHSLICITYSYYLEQKSNLQQKMLRYRNEVTVILLILKRRNFMSCKPFSPLFSPYLSHAGWIGSDLADIKWCWGSLQRLWNVILSLYFSCSFFPPNAISFLWQQRFWNSPWNDCMSCNWKTKWLTVISFALIWYPSFNATHIHLLSHIQTKTASSDTETDPRGPH